MKENIIEQLQSLGWEEAFVLIGNAFPTIEVSLTVPLELHPAFRSKSVAREPCLQ